jgi:hypothetical protein
LVFYAFDLLHLDRIDLIREPLAEAGVAEPSADAEELAAMNVGIFWIESGPVPDRCRPPPKGAEVPTSGRSKVKLPLIGPLVMMPEFSRNVAEKLTVVSMPPEAGLEGASAGNRVDRTSG